MYGGLERLIQDFGTKSVERRHLEDPDIGRRIIL
jgi:hypothetical protein